MKRSTRLQNTIWSFICAPLLLLIVLLAFDWDRIEKDVAANANEALSGEHDWARAETFNRGRDVIIVGSAPDQEAVEQALRSTQAAAGVRRVDFAGTIAPALRAAELSFKFQTDTVLLSGTSGSKAALNTLINQATQIFAPRSVINQVAVAPQVKPLPDMRAVMEASKAISGNTTIALTGTRLTAAGEMPDQRSLDLLLQRLIDGFNGGVINQLRVAAVIENTECESNLDALLASGSIFFKTGGSDIDPSSNELLRNLADMMQRCPDATFQIAGHTDAVGDPETNLSLSRKRAASVVQALTGMGLEENRFEIVGYGSNAPLADNRTAAGRAKNRRIEFNLIE